MLEVVELAPWEAMLKHTKAAQTTLANSKVKNWEYLSASFQTQRKDVENVFGS